MFDVIRPYLWSQSDVARWYKQNTFLVIKKGKEDIILKHKSFSEKIMLGMVHPEYYNMRVKELIKAHENLENARNELNRIHKGTKSMTYYLKLFIKRNMRIFKTYKNK